MRATLVRVGAVVGGLAVILLLHIVGFLRPVEDGARNALLPVMSGAASISQTWGGAGMTNNVPALQAQVQDLQARLASISVDYVKLKSLEEENQLLRDTAKFLSDTGYDHVSARVIARSSDASHDSILIDRGSNDGIELGMAVISGDGIFVGKVTTLQERVSTVTLVADPTSRVAASPLSNDHLYGLIQGQGDGVAVLTLVPQTEPLKPNDVVVTAGTEEKVPPGLPVALVNEVEGKATDPFKTATLEPLARVDQLDLVAVLRPAVLRPTAGN